MGMTHQPAWHWFVLHWALLVHLGSQTKKDRASQKGPEHLTPVAMAPPGLRRPGSTGDSFWTDAASAGRACPRGLSSREPIWANRYYTGILDLLALLIPSGQYCVYLFSS